MDLVQDETAATAGTGVAPPAPAAALPYADAPARWGVRLQRRADGVRVDVPPPPASWRYVSTSLLAGAGFATVAGWTAGVAVVSRGGIGEVIPPVVMYAAAAAACALHILYRLTAHTTFTVTADSLVASVRTFARPLHRSGRWDRRAVAGVKVSGESGRLVIKVPGRDDVTFYVCPDRGVTEWVANVLRAAVADGSFAAAACPAGLDAPGDPPGRDRRPAGRLVWAAAAGVLAGVGLLFYAPAAPFGGAVLGVTCLATTVAAGITLGTQEKDFFT